MRKTYTGFFVLLLSVLLLIIVSGCQVEEDKYPEVPFLADVLDDEKFFKKIKFLEENDQVVITQSNHLYVRNIDKGLDKIVTINNDILYSSSMGSYPGYFDTNGHYYSNGKKYLAPNYKAVKGYVLIDVRDSLRIYEDKITEQGTKTDSIIRNKIESYNWSIYSKYDLILERETFLKSSIDTVKVKGDTLIFFSKNRKNDFIKKATPFKEFDDSIIINTHSTGGHFGMPCIDYMNYLLINENLKVKTKDHDKVWKLYVLDKKQYLFDGFSDLYEILN
jgi:hypothetical protein